ncbi:MAG TPA: ABC transporter permease [Limnochordales bacterium]
MWRFIGRRLIQMIPMLLGISLLSFLIMYAAPGSFVNALKLRPDLSPETIARIEAQLGLDQPVLVQYLRWLWNLLRLDLGQSFTYQVPVTYLIGSRAVATLLLAVSSAAISWLLAFPLGVYAAVRAHTGYDRVLTFVSLLGLSIPNFFLAMLLLFAVVRWRLPLPVGGMTSPGASSWSFWEQVLDVLRHLLIPAVVLGTAGVASLTRYLRSGLLDVLRQEYITTARAKGLPERAVIWRHALRNALNVMITLFGFELGGLLSGAALTEIITSWPGLGQLILEAVQSQDYYLVMGSVTIGGVMLVLGNLIADILLAWADPRVRLT